MLHNLEVFGLALVAAIAIGATSAPTAAGIQVTAGEYPAALTGESITHNKNPPTIVTNGSVKMTCSARPTEGTVAEPLEALTTSPAYEGCTIHFVEKKEEIEKTTKYDVEIDMTGCDYVGQGGTADAAHHFKEVTTSLECPEGVTGPHVKIWFDFVAQPCLYTVEATGSSGQIGITSETGFPNQITVDYTLSTAIKRDGSLLCGAVNQTWMVTGAETMRAYQDLEAGEGFQIGLTVSE